MHVARVKRATRWNLHQNAPDAAIGMKVPNRR
jgi:hypothetical protein